MRLFGCDLACRGCPNPESVQTQYAASAKSVPSKYLAGLINAGFPGFGLIVFTGGEPTVQENAVGEICDALSMRGGLFETAIETNGRRRLERYYDHVVVSPKLPSDGNREYSVLCDGPKSHYRFLCGSDSDFDDAMLVLGRLKARPSPERVWFRHFAPSSVQAEEIRSKCLRHGFCYQ